MEKKNIFLLLFGVSYLVPLFWFFIQGFRPRVDIFAIPPRFPTNFVMEHFRNLFIRFDFLTPMFHSFIVAGSTTIIVVGLSILTGYSLSRYHFPGVDYLLVFIIVVRMVVPAALLIPLYHILVLFNLVNTPIAIILGHLAITLPLMLWLAKVFVDGVPESLEDQAVVDGMSTLERIRKVIVPMIVPGLATIAILTFIFSWGEYMFAVSFGPRYTVGATAIANMMTTYKIWWGEIAAGGIIYSIPVLIIGIFFQQYFVRGLTAGSVKG